MSARNFAERTDIALTKDDLVTLLPHLGDDCLARVEDSSEADLDVLERSEFPENVLARDTEGAETLFTSVWTCGKPVSAISLETRGSERE